jgi:hypothetical protein
MRIGKAKFIVERWRSNVGMGQFLLTSYIAIKVGDFPIWLFISFFIVSIAYTIWCDIKYIYPTESAIGFQKNPEFMEMKETLKRIEEKL